MEGITTVAMLVGGEGGGEEPIPMESHESEPQ
jgi:hypothetical protein